MVADDDTETASPLGAQEYERAFDENLHYRKRTKCNRCLERKNSYDCFFLRVKRERSTIEKCTGCVIGRKKCVFPGAPQQAATSSKASKRKARQPLDQDRGRRVTRSRKDSSSAVDSGFSNVERANPRLHSAPLVSASGVLPRVFVPAGPVATSSGVTLPVAPPPSASMTSSHSEGVGVGVGVGAVAGPSPGMDTFYRIERARLAVGSFAAELEDQIQQVEQMNREVRERGFRVQDRTVSANAAIHEASVAVEGLAGVSALPVREAERVFRELVGYSEVYEAFEVRRRALVEMQEEARLGWVQFETETAKLEIGKMEFLAKYGERIREGGRLALR